MTIKEKEHLFPAIETISKWCKGHECGEGCEFYIDLFISSENDDSERFVGKHCLFDSCPSAWIREFEKLEQLDSSDIDAAYHRGLEEAWEGARKLLFDSSLSRDILTDLGADSFCGIIHDCSASEAVEKLKEYEEQQITISEEQREKNLQRIFDTKKQTEENLCADCETCRFADLTAHEFPCSACSASHTFRWEARKGASE